MLKNPMKRGRYIINCIGLSFRNLMVDYMLIHTIQPVTHGKDVL